MLILGIETSCDETSVALVEDGKKILVNLVATQIDLHRQFGGVVPEVASRAHLRVLAPLVREALERTGAEKESVSAIAYTIGPGLIGSLLVGVSLAKALAYSWSVPAIGVNHLKAHLYAPILAGEEFEFPLVGLIVSGGHTLLVSARSWDEAEIVGSTRDDAAGEAFDKVAALLGLGFPGGPAVDRAAREGDSERFDLPRGMIRSGDLDFSFSGVKTAVRYLVERLKADGEEIPAADIAAGFQRAAVDVLVAKLTAAAGAVSPRTVVIGGGVAGNSELRRRVSEAPELSSARVLIAPLALCSDNAAMIAGLAGRQLERGGELTTGLAADDDPNLPWTPALL
ncbi:MAG: tRNA (adenosine(37)-N6)-threonylcarbamoyltransferase complex transferase subunit TsaD [Candidatus Erginobacter occultus]|nr:tRNA (adenosine(37)-N6)-threonylcarbamoyltransferase complex transferase subunit TsaD [Candidatus Erginobacter occultus]